MSIVLIFQYLPVTLNFSPIASQILAWDLCYGNFCVFGPTAAAYL